MEWAWMPNGFGTDAEPIQNLNKPQKQTLKSSSEDARTMIMDSPYLRLIRKNVIGLNEDELVDLLNRGFSITQIATQVYGVKDPIPWAAVYKEFYT